MTDTPKTIQEALAEVQRRVNQNRALRTAEMVSEISGEPLDEAGLLSGAVKAASNFASNLKRGATVSGPAVKAIERGDKGKFVSPGSASKSGLAVGKAVKPVVDNPKTSAAGAVGGAAAIGAASHTAFSKSNSSTSTPSTPAKPAVDSSAKGAKYVGGKSHSVTTLNKSDAGQQASVKSKTTEKGWADPGKFENMAKSQTGSMQQIRGGKVLPPSTQLGTPKSMDKPAAKPVSSSQTPQQRWDAAKQSTGVNSTTAKAQTTAVQSRPSGETSTSNFLKSQGIGSSESGKSSKKKVSESIIDAFFKIQEDKTGNMFEAAKHLSPKQKKIAAVAGDPDKIDADDFKALRAKKMEEESVDHLGASTVTKDKKGYVDPSTPKVPYSQLPKPGNKAGEIISKAKDAAGMKEQVEELDELSKKTLKSYQRKATTSSERSWAKADKEEDKAMSTDGNKYPYKQEKHQKNAKEYIDTWRKREKGLEAVKKKLHKEEVEFSESEIQYINSVINNEGNNE